MRSKSAWMQLPQVLQNLCGFVLVLKTYEPGFSYPRPCVNTWNLVMARNVRYFTLSEGNILSTRVYKKIAIRGTTRATALDNWMSRKWPFERDAELDITAVACCLMCGAFCFWAASTMRSVVMLSCLGVVQGQRFYWWLLRKLSDCEMMGNMMTIERLILADMFGQSSCVTIVCGAYQLCKVTKMWDCANLTLFLMKLVDIWNCEVSIVKMYGSCILAVQMPLWCVDVG